MARFELHVWGAALGLQSIDAECLAAITYFTRAFPKERWNEWTVIESNDPAISPPHRLPALHHDGVWTSGYHHVVKYLSRHATTSSYLIHDPANRPLAASPAATAAADDGRPVPDALAHSTYLASRASALVDLLLHASATNWAAATRPAHGRLVGGFPLSWVVPAALRADALRRVERFGFSNMEADGADAEDVDDDAEEKSANVPASFRWKGLGQDRQKGGVMQRLTAEQMVGIRLADFAKSVLDVLLAWVKRRDYGKDEGASCETGCLVYGYLALMIRPDVPRAWLRRLIERDYGVLMDFYNVTHLRLESLKEDIPSTEHRCRSASRQGARFLHHVVQNVPGIGAVYLGEWRRRLAEGPTSSSKLVDGRAAMFLSGVILSGAALGCAYRLYVGLQPFGARSALFFRAPPAAGPDGSNRRHRGGVGGGGGGVGGLLGSVLERMAGGITDAPGPRKNSTSVVDFGGPERGQHVVADVQVELNGRSKGDS